MNGDAASKSWAAGTLKNLGQAKNLEERRLKEGTP